MTTDANKALQDPSYNSTGWNVPLNANFDNIDAAFGGVQAFNLAAASGTVNVSGTVYVGAYPANTPSYIPLVFSLTGTMTANVILSIPSGVGGRWLVNNATSGAFSVTIASAGGGASITATQGSITDCYSDGTNVFAIISSGGNPAGTIIPYAANSTPSGYLLCYGQSVAISTYTALYAAIGTTWGGSGGNFNLPDLRGRVIAGPDNMGGVAAGRLSGYTYGVGGGVSDVTLSVAQIPAHTHGDYGHGHGVSDPGHQHHLGWNTAQSMGAGGYNTLTRSFGTGGVYTDAAGTGIGVATGYANLANTGGSGSHTNTQPTLAINWIIKY